MKPSLLNISKTMAFATAIGAASAAWATVFPGSTDFEDVTLPDDYTVEAAAVISQIETPPDVATRPAHYDYASSQTNVLEIETSADSPVFRKLNAEGTNEVGTIYVDMLVKPSAVFAHDASPTNAPDDKLLVYFKDDGNGTNNLCVLAAYWNEEMIVDEFTLDTPLSVGALDKDKWYRLIIKAKEIQSPDTLPAFNIFLGGSGENYLCKKSGTQVADFISLKYETVTASQVAKVGFAGSGFVDDFVASDIDPDAVVTVPFTLTWPSGVTAVSYTVDGGEPTAISGASSPLAINVQDGAVVAFTFTNADGATKTMTATASSSVNEIDAEDAVWGWSDYLGDAVSGAYTIDDANDLDMLRKGVDAGLATSNETFRQTANIDMTSAGAFAGIGAVGAENATTLTMTAFEGTYDGNNKTISNIIFTNRKGSALFNLVRGATIKDLTVDTVSYESDFGASKLGGAMIVGNGVGCTLQHLITTGSNGLNNPSTYNAGGIANRLELRGGDILVVGCTNNAAIYCVYTKVAGICPIVECSDGTGSIAFVDCANTGSIVANGTAAQIENNGGKTPGADGAAGILGYTQGAGTGTISFTNCVSTGTIEGASGATIGSIIGKYNRTAGAAIVGGSANANYKSLNYNNSSSGHVSGADFATVDDGVATFVDAFALNGEYKVMADRATATYNFTALGTISFDTALATPTYNITSSGVAGYPVASTSGTVTTYTAGYFPRTATAGQDGSAANPFEIADEDDLLALQAAVTNDVGRNLAYVQVADIALTAAWPGIGVKAGKDLVNGNKKDIPTYEAHAFSGTYDGGNFTISNFQMENGADYGALFNSINNATIKNLKLSWGANLLTPGTTSDSGDTGASFVGVARGSTLQNLTTLRGTVTSVSASKDMGGIVGYLMAGSTVESCTNEIDIVSIKNTGRKCGGIAIITQDGTGSAIIRNCKNSGTVTAANKGGLAGYIGVATEIDGCENTAALQLFHFQSGSVTVSGVNKGNATVASNDKSGGVTNLYFATVDGSVATFVADNALALNGEYKVMSAGATATYAFAEAGTIAFDTALYTPTYAITAAEGLDLTDETSGTVKTYTAAAPAPAYPTYLEGADADVIAAYDAWKTTNGADSESAYENQFLVNAAPATVVPNNALSITEIVQNETAGWDITIECNVSGVDLSGTVGTAKAGNGYLAVSYTDALGGTWTTENIAITASANGKVTVNVNKSGAKFMKVKLTAKEEPQN